MRMPPELTERAHAIVYGGDWTPPPAKPAATVVLLRDGAEGLQVAVLHKALGFAKGMYVFPGGAVEDSDAELGEPARVAAIRETFEECGVLLSQPPATATDRERDFAELLDELGVAPAFDALHPFAHWITPEVESRRFDTQFFAAALPDGAALAELTAEHSAMDWYSPDDAAQLRMLPPTAAVVAELREFDTVADVLAVQRDPIPLLPHPVADGEGGIRWVLVDYRTGEPL